MNTLTKQDLMKFCSTDQSRVRIGNPWSIGEYTVATNGHILIRIPRLPDVPENPKAPRIDKGVFPKSAPEVWYSIPEFEVPKLIACQACLGRACLLYTSDAADE